MSEWFSAKPLLGSVAEQTHEAYLAWGVLGAA